MTTLTTTYNVMVMRIEDENRAANFSYHYHHHYVNDTDKYETGMRILVFACDDKTTKEQALPRIPKLATVISRIPST